MTTAASAHQRAFAVWFEDLSFWDARSQRLSQTNHCDWPTALLSDLCAIRFDTISEHELEDGDIQLLDKISFADGKIFSGKRTETMMTQFRAKPGDIVVSKINARKKAVGIVPVGNDLGMTIHFRSLVPVANKVDTCFLWLALRSQFCINQFDIETGGGGKGEISEQRLLLIKVPLPPLSVQYSVVDYWKFTQTQITDAEKRLVNLKQRVSDYLHSVTVMEPCVRKALVLSWDKLESWDVKSSRAAAFKLANPAFKPLREYAEEATESVKPRLEPEKDWPVYGVNNKEGVFFSDYQKGADFNAPYKRIQKDWFFHNPTRSSVGSLGIVPEVPEDAITSPEYQVWRIRNGLLTGFAAIMITTEYFIKLIQFNRVGAVKQRLYVENLLSIPIPEIPEEFQRAVADEREKALAAIAEARIKVAEAAVEIESIILGTKKVDQP